MMCVDPQIAIECDQYCNKGRNCKWMRHARRIRPQADEHMALLQVAGAARMLVRVLPNEQGITILKQAVENLDEAQAIK